jgi:tRNA (guanine10-N2)-dimethyltransferase
MTYVYRLAGENLDLARAELGGFLKSQGIEEIRHGEKIARTSEHPSQLRRLALTHEVGEIIDPENISVNGSFAVRTENLTREEFDSKKVEKELGEKLSGLTNEVDLEDPSTVIKVYNTKEGLIYTRLVEDIPRGLYEKRANEKRPFSSPISLDPVLARVLVNLSELPLGEKILDPFCGTGGILIESGLCGIGVKGLDIQEEMVSGTEENLEEYGVISHDIRQGDVSEADKIFGDYSAIVTDIPYGKASKQEEDAVEKFLNLIEDFGGKTVFMYNKASLGGYEADFEVYVHKSLTRYIFVV